MVKKLGTASHRYTIDPKLNKFIVLSQCQVTISSKRVLSQTKKP